MRSRISTPAAIRRRSAAGSLLSLWRVCGCATKIIFAWPGSPRYGVKTPQREEEFKFSNRVNIDEFEFLVACRLPYRST